MTSNEPIGKLSRKEDSTTVEWQIADFSTLSYEEDTLYRSPVFSLRDECCRLRLSPNGKVRSSEFALSFSPNGRYFFKGCLFMALVVGGQTSLADITITVCLKGVNGSKELGEVIFNRLEKIHRSTVFKFCKRSEVMNRSSVLLPNDVLTIQCTVKNMKPYPVRVSVFQRLQNLSSSLKAILNDGKRSDVVFNVRGRKIAAHRFILESRSEVFKAIFRRKTTENKSGEVAIEDVGADVFQQVLHYVYSGQVEKISVDNMFELYAAADKYLLKELKDLCTAFIEQTMSVDTFCDILAFADTHNEEGLVKLAKDFFAQNSTTILESEKWRKFLGENNAVAVRLLVSTVKENALNAQFNASS